MREDRGIDKLEIDRRLLLAGGAMAGLMSAAEAAAETPCGAVTAATGAVSAELRAARRELQAASQVFVGDRVSTGQAARASLRLGAATELRLGERARIAIDRFLVDAGGVITLGAGPVLLDKQPGSGGRIDIRSAYGLIAVRGTQVFAGPSNGVFGVFVQRGLVTVRAAGRAVTLRSGEGTDIARPGAPPTPARAWGQPRIDAALAAVR